jgi:hypothetical protein
LVALTMCMRVAQAGISTRPPTSTTVASDFSWFPKPADAAVRDQDVVLRQNRTADDVQDARVPEQNRTHV